MKKNLFILLKLHNISCRPFLITDFQGLPLEGVSTPGAEAQKFTIYNQTEKHSTAEKQSQCIYCNSTPYCKASILVFIWNVSKKK